MAVPEPATVTVQTKTLSTPAAKSNGEAKLPLAPIEPASKSLVNGNGAAGNGQSLAPPADLQVPTDRPSPKSIGSSFSPPPPASATLSPSSGPNLPRKSSLSRSPPASKFTPDLPDSLPHPSDPLPVNRKRKTPTDFGETPGSPGRSAVKFEDGIGPGEGKDGETTIKKPKSNQNVIERTIWTFIMIGVFIALLCLGHPYMILLVMLCQTLVYKEVTALFDLRDEGTKSLENDLWSKTLNWYFLVVTNYFLYGESIIYYFKHIVFVDAFFIPFARNHRFISFMLYMVGFVGFVGNLQRQYLRQQFALFCWVHITLLLIVVSSHFIVNNILEGHVWFFIPASLVICNDVMAYVCGKLFGRTPLIKLSPKKTVEGFVGAFICTLIFGLLWGTFFMRFKYMVCPARDLGTNVFSHVTCKLNPVFVWRDYEFTGPIRNILETILGHAPPTVPYAPFQLHVLVMATFASLVAPFGGFFASGFKRAFNIKDFGDSIPGHGGMTDRMDCQFMMGMFSYVYYSSLIRIQYVTVGSIMQTVVTSLSASEQLELLKDLRTFLKGQGVRV
ncbi:cytidylyltransferase family-domain-containing protein [Kockovaella imperatae]|uniref:Phosphatidate cytidylyltransferase n=1 Tax=Kockovaella imperatae TaxID=4999 RepID=A0A1Y1UAK3_9TREE|nr:cytidylyltransferase family-domain-containing protein [Kockovaella imperatae]ORX34526.1 cytidylyltransferase family-domain-containing protein [Kockovaella imperatae]